MNLELWYRTFIDREGVQTLSAPPIGRSSGPAEAVPYKTAISTVDVSS
jgi:hypothetical protein